MSCVTLWRSDEASGLHCCSCQRPLSIHALFTHFNCVCGAGGLSLKKLKLSPFYWFIFVFRSLLSPFLLSPYRLFRLLCVKYWQGQEARGRWRANASVIPLLSHRNVSRWGPRSAKLLILVFFFYFVPRPIHQSKLGPSERLNDTPTGLRKFDNGPHCQTALFFSW